MEVLSQDEQQMMSQVPIGAIFHHYKGRAYKILHIGRSSEDNSLCVIYQALYRSEEFGNYAIWTRMLKGFLETVVIEGKEVPRFTLTHQPIHE